MMMIQAGADLVTVMSTLGHSKIETTQRYLSEDFEVSARVANQVISNIFDHTTPQEKKQKKACNYAPHHLGRNFFREVGAISVQSSILCYTF